LPKLTGIFLTLTKVEKEVKLAEQLRRGSIAGLMNFRLEFGKAHGDVNLSCDQSVISEAQITSGSIEILKTTKGIFNECRTVTPIIIQGVI
jgi:hypothetical protein